MPKTVLNRWTSAVALTTGFMQSLGIPAPYLMGSLFGVWVVGGFYLQYSPSRDCSLVSCAGCNGALRSNWDQLQSELIAH